MNFEPVFSVIIPVFNNWNLTHGCLVSLAEQTPEPLYEVIVVDNGSTDDTAANLEPLGHSLFGERFRAIRFAANRDFGPACNTAASVAVAPLLFFLNNDTRLLPDWMAPLLTEFADSETIGAASPLLLYPDRRVQHLGVAFGTMSTDHLYRGFASRHPVVQKRRKLRALSAAALMVPRDLFFEAGAFFEEYRNGFEDLELSTRLIALGRYLICIPESQVLHLESRTAGRYEAENANAALFHSRLGHTVVPDRHIHALRDGFYPFITDALDIGLRLPPELENSLVKEVEGKSLDHWAELAGQHPLWLRGRDIIAHTLERAGHWEQSIAWRTEAATIIDSRQGWSELAHSATMAGDDRVRVWAEARLANVFEKDKAEGMARRFLRAAEHRADKLLAGLFERKLAALAKAE